MARRRFFVREISRGRASIAGDEAHHLTRVLRVEAGQRYEISDNHKVWLAEVETARRDLVTFTVIEQVQTPPARVDLTAYVALVKFERLELLVEKATELGVRGIVLFPADRSEKGLERAAEKRLPRWERIAREASEQSRRPQLPTVELLPGLNDIVTGDATARILLDEARDAKPLIGTLPAQLHEGERVSILAGPEGGWTERERELIQSFGWRAASLGDTILRTETAVLAAAAIVQAWWHEHAARNATV